MKRQISDYVNEHREEITEPAFLTLSHPDIVGFMLSNHPVSLLRLISTTKAMSGMIKAITFFFINFLDAMLINETNNPYYAFYVTMYHEQQPLYQNLLILKRKMRILGPGYHRLVSRKLGLDVVIRDHVYDYYHNNNNTSSTFGEAHDILTQKLASSGGKWISMYQATRFYKNIFLTERVQELNESNRRLLCYLVTCHRPYSISDFYVLDSRRLHYARCNAQFRSDLVQYLLTEYEYSSDIPPEASEILLKMKWRNPNLVNVGALVTVLHSQLFFDGTEFIDFPRPLRKLLYQLRNITIIEIDPLNNIRQGVTKFKKLMPEIDFSATEALLQLEVPEPYQFLDIKEYRDQLMVYYHTNNLEKELLLGELRYIKERHGIKYVQDSYSSSIHNEISF